MSRSPLRLKAPSLPGFCQIAEATERLATAGIEERGAVFTKRPVVEFILDLVGYTTDRPLHTYRLLEPAFGHGDFLIPVIERLLEAFERENNGFSDPVANLRDSIRAVEIHRASVAKTRAKALELLLKKNLSASQANQLLDVWIVEGDFLLVDLPFEFTHTVGNPPYIRQELIADVLMSEYRSRYSTIYDRADIYVPFIERSLFSLERGGTLGFICTDRWMKNRYGAPLRALVANHFHLATYVDMVNTPAFHNEVMTYPAITVIRRVKGNETRIAHRPEINSTKLVALAAALRGDTAPRNSEILEAVKVANGSEPWILNSFDQLAIVRRLEDRFPRIEDAGCKVGIGVATGADRIFIGRSEDLDVEDDRKLPIVMTKDIRTGHVSWQGLWVINPFNDDGSLADLTEYPRFGAYMLKYGEAIRRRNVAKRNANGWYRTIDRIYPQLALKPKLLIPDIKGEAHIVYESGKLYPHHNLYFITSDEWDLKALQAVLMSGIAKLFVSTYSTQMRGGYLRFQAQYLRRIRLPKWTDVSEKIRDALITAAYAGDLAACNNAVFELYGMSTAERAALGGSGN